MFNRFIFCLMVLSLTLPFVYAEEAKTEKEKIKDEKAEAKIDTAKLKEIISKINSLFVKVNFYLKYDKGEAPKIGGYLCGKCSTFHGVDAGDYVEEERPVQATGYIISPTEIICADLQVPPRFLDKLEVISGDTKIKGVIDSYYLDQHAILIKLTKPLNDQKFQKFIKPEKDAMLLNINYSIDDGLWKTSITPAPRKLLLFDDIGKELFTAPPNCFLVTKKGDLAGISINGKFAVNGSISPLEWKKLKVSEFETKVTELSKLVKGAIIHLKLNFRSPRMKPGRKSFSYRSSSKKSISTELYTSGMIFSKNKVLIFAALKPKETARLESITAFIGNKEVELKFICSLKDYNAIIAKSASDLTVKPLLLADKTIRKEWNKFLFKSNIVLKGDLLTYHCGHTWISGYSLGWKKQYSPNIPGDKKGAFLFDKNLNLLAFPLARRDKAKMERSYSYNRNKKNLISVEYIKNILDNPLNHADNSNIPVPEKEEGRIAWLGIEAQALNSELARTKKVSDLTEDGRKGILITYIYHDSPAAKANLKPGDILLRVKSEGESKPIPLAIRNSRSRPFPWAQYERIPEQYYERLPTPWQSVENELNSFLTNLGFDKKIKIDCFVDGKVIKKDFTISKSPIHFEMATKYKDKKLGMTVRNLTYEVQRYFQKTKESPGVIIAKIEPGSKASIAGLKPYEIIVNINGKAVKNVKDFEKLVKNKEQLRFGVERMSVTRTVKLDIPIASEKE